MSQQPKKRSTIDDALMAANLGKYLGIYYDGFRGIC